ncbi:MAG: glycosyltransferase family 87 protein [Dehalococcoidia bacterium]
MIAARLNKRAFLVLTGLLLAIGVPGAYFGIDRWFSHWLWLNDMHYFYDAAKVVLDGHRDILYDYQARFDAGYGLDPNDQVFPYPATAAYLFSPLTLTSVANARYWFTGFCILLLVAIAVIGAIWSRDLRFGLLLMLLPASSFTVYETLRFQQLSPVLALMLSASLLTAASTRSVAGGFVTSLLALKPSIAAAPLGLIALRRGHRQIAAAILGGALIFILIPLVVVGIDGIFDYLEMLSRYRNESFTLHGKLTAGAGWMLGWQSIVGRLGQSDPNVYLVVGLDILTVLVMLKVWLRGRYFESYLAGTLTTLLVVPHVLWYDWTILIGVAPFVAYENRSLPLVGLLLALHAAISFDSYMIVTRPIFDAYPVPTPLLAGAILLYLAFAPLSARDAPSRVENDQLMTAT